MRRPVKLAVVFSSLLVLGFLAQQSAAPAEPVTVPVAVQGDAGDGLAPTTYDGPMLRKRSAIAIRPAKGADRNRIRAELQERIKKHPRVHGPLTEATFAVFGKQMLNYLVPEMTFVLPEDVPATDAEAFMRDEQPDDVAFYLVQNVLVHQLTFAVVTPFGADPARVLAKVEREGILTDELFRYDVTVQPHGLVIRYFGAVLSDTTIASVRGALGRAAGLDPERVIVDATVPTGGVDLSFGVPDLEDAPSGHHGG